ncbi:hypothetical protein SRHO_G00125670 [Serrasalmus rhombeus]
MDVISLSSGPGSEEEDSDIEFVRSYNNGREDAVPFITAELLPVTPVLIDITGHNLSTFGPRYSLRSRRGQSSTIEVIDLNNDSLPSDSSSSDTQLQRITADGTLTDAENCVESSTNAVTKPCGNNRLLACNANLEKNVICLDPDGGDGCQSPLFMSSGQEKCSRDQYDSVHSGLEEMSIRNKSGDISQCEKRPSGLDQSAIKTPQHSETFDNSPQFHTVPTQTLQNTKDTQEMFSLPADHSTELQKEYNENLDFPQSWLDKDPSPFSLDSPYYCPSEIDDILFSEESNDGDNKELLSTPWSFSGLRCTESPTNTPVETTDLHEKEHMQKSPIIQAQSQFPCDTLPTSSGVSPTSSLPCGQPCSPTSTELLAGDSPDTLASSHDLAMESPPSSPSLPSPLPSSAETLLLSCKNSKALVSSESCPSSPWQRSSKDDQDEDGNCSESHMQVKQHISLAQYKKLKHLIGRGAQEVPEHGAEEDINAVEPLCRQSLSLVYSTIEENYPEGTVQLLSDLIQPRYYPPLDITTHLLRGILLDPQCAEVLTLEAYNLLMRIQKYHPADIATLPWDWDLLSAVMTEQIGVQSEARCLLFQYVLQVLEDDFHFKLSMLRLNLSVAKAVLSCHQKFRQVRDLMNWLLDVAKQSFCKTKDEKMQKREQNCCLRMLLILQRMLLLAMEVDRTPTCSSNKLSQELCNSLNSTAPCRQLRLLLLSTLESNLLRCKLLELLLDQACSQKRPLPMSFKLLLHFLQTSTLAPDPSDGTERWKKWDELLQLVWMLMLSYEEVMTGHLRCSITERFTLTRAPMWTQNDQVTRASVQEAAEAFLSRAVEDLGHALPSQIQESLSQLQEHLLRASRTETRHHARLLTVTLIHQRKPETSPGPNQDTKLASGGWYAFKVV